MLEKFILSRRQFLSILLAAVPSVSVAHGLTTEPDELRVSYENLKLPGLSVRFVHFSDLHYRGESPLARRVRAEVHRLRPDFACFTGDFIDGPEVKDEAFSFIRSLGCPVYAVPGNHDYRSGVAFKEFEELFASTGGAWLEDRSVIVPEMDLEIRGIGIGGGGKNGPRLSENRILLTHFPQSVERISGTEFAAVLAGHSHGGQVRFPLVGSLYLPPGVGRYEFGKYMTPVGPLHVNAGIGTSFMPIRLNCPPQLSVFQT